MNRFHNISFALLCTAALAMSCTEDTGSIGIIDTTDAISTQAASFMCYTSSVALDSMRSSSAKCYLGQITDPETGTMLKADFAAQYNVVESVLLPPASKVICDENGNFECDSVNLRLFFQKHYGNETAPFKLNIYELSMQEDRMLREDSVYYTNVNLSNFIATKQELDTRKGMPSGVEWPVTKVFTPKDYTANDSTLNSSTHYNNINIKLPASYGKRILNLYRTNPEYFASSYHFIRNVCPGFYYNLTDGSGAMMYVDVSSLDVYFRYHNTDTTTTQGVCRFSATGEVIQMSRFVGGGNEALIADNSCTYIKSPAGIGTVVKIPVEEIYKGHESDSLALASITFTRYNATGSKYALSPVSQIAMVERSELAHFFDKGKQLSARSFAVATLSPSYNIYAFSNIGRLISYLREKKSDEVVLVPVTVNTGTGNQVLSITPDMSIASTQLVGGSDTPIKLQVVYSRYYK